MEGKQTQNLGGVSKQLCPCLLQDVPSKLGLFEANGLLWFSTDNLLRGSYRKLGHLIVTSMLQERPSFPHSAKTVKTIFGYFTSQVKKAVTYLCTSERLVWVEFVVIKVSGETTLMHFVTDSSPTRSYLATLEYSTHSMTS